MQTTVLHAAKFYPPVRGGMETVMRDLCDGTAGEWNVRVVAANDRAETVRERCGGVDVVRAAAFGKAASVPLCPSLPLDLWRQPRGLRGAARAESDCRNGALSAHAGAAAGRLAPQRSRAAVVGAGHIRPRAARAVPPRRLRDRVESRAGRRVAARPARRRVAVIPFGVALERYRAWTRSAARGRPAGWPPSPDRACCSSAASCTTRASTC